MLHFTRIFIFISIFSSRLHGAESLGHKYNTYVNKAELAIVESDYSDALRLYENAFQNTKIEFSVDVYNACVCAIKLGQTKKLLFFADRLAAKGVGRNFFKKKIFQNYINDKDFFKILEKAEKTKNENFEMNESYTKKMDSFFSLDSLYNRIRLTKYSSYADLPDTLETLFKKNTLNLLDFIKTNGYYSENKLGTYVIEDTIIRVKSKPDIVFLHYLEMGRDKVISNAIKNVLLDNLNLGNIKQYHIASTIELTSGLFNYTGSFLYNIFDCKLYKINEQQRLEEINLNRDAYCMDSISDFEKKIIFKYSRISDFDFRYIIIKAPVHDKTYFEESYHQIATIENCN